MAARSLASGVVAAALVAVVGELFSLPIFIMDLSICKNDRLGPLPFELKRNRSIIVVETTPNKLLIFGFCSHPVSCFLIGNRCSAAAAGGAGKRWFCCCCCRYAICFDHQLTSPLIQTQLCFFPRPPKAMPVLLFFDYPSREMSVGKRLFLFLLLLRHFCLRRDHFRRLGQQRESFLSLFVYIPFWKHNFAQRRRVFFFRSQSSHFDWRFLTEQQHRLMREWTPSRRGNLLQQREEPIIKQTSSGVAAYFRGVVAAGELAGS